MSWSQRRGELTAKMGSWASCRRLGQLTAVMDIKSRGDSEVIISLWSTCEGATYSLLFGSTLDP